MRIRPYPLILILIVILFLFSASSVFATSFSVATGATTPAPPDDILVPGPAPIIVGSTPLPIEVDAFSFGHLGVGLGDISAVEFSVAIGSVGAPASAVFAEAIPGGEPQADIFSTSGLGTNTLVFDGDGSSGPSLTLTETFGGPDEVDGYDKNPAPLLGPAPGLIWFSYGAGPITTPDIHVAPAVAGYTFPPPTVFVSATALGLTTADDIDALVVLEDGALLGGPMSPGDCVLFSLAVGSPSLIPLGYSPADILYEGLGCPGSLPGPDPFASAILLGLLPTDDLDALSIPFTPTAVTLQEISFQPDYGYRPILMTGFALATVGLTLFVWRRRKRILAET